MKKQFLLIITLFLSLNTLQAQRTFEPGYFINNNGDTVKCLIKNSDWYYNPIYIKYQLNTNGKIETATLNEVKEFKIGESIKYVRKAVLIDKSSEVIENMDRNFEPNFKPDTLFLKVLAQGNANLYNYYSKELNRFFYDTNNQEVKQLVYKLYLDKDNQIATNNSYKEQILKDFKLLTSEQKSNLYKLNYELKSLTNFFNQYNPINTATKSSQLVANSSNSKNAKPFSLSVRPRINYSNLGLKTVLFYSKDVKFDNKPIIAIGAEAEYLLPYNKSKWAISIEPTYHTYNNKAVTDINYFNEVSYQLIKYNSLEVPTTVRHYLYLNNKSKLFINASTIFDFPFNSYIQNIDYNLNENSKKKLVFSVSFGCGIGYKLKNKYSIELRQNFNRDLLPNKVNIISKYNTSSLVLGYTIF